MFFGKLFNALLSIFIVLAVSVLLTGCSEIVPEDKNKTEDVLEDDARKKIGASCENDYDCELVMKYAIRSNCPYEMACIENSCAVVCQMTENNSLDPQQCIDDSDCNCSGYDPEKLKDCTCHQGSCIAVAED